MESKQRKFQCQNCYRSWILNIAQEELNFISPEECPYAFLSVVWKEITNTNIFSKFDLNVMWKRILEFNDKYFPNWRKNDEVYLSNALAGEAGEVCNITKHRKGGGTNFNIPPSNFELMEELADVFIYMVMLVEHSNISNLPYPLNTFAGIIQHKINRNVMRMKKQKEKEKKRIK